MVFTNVQSKTSQSVHFDMNIQAHPGATVTHNETYPWNRIFIVQYQSTRLLLKSDISNVPQHNPSSPFPIISGHPNS